MRTLLFATAAVTALCLAAPASARVLHHYYGAYSAYGAYRGIPDYGYYYGQGYHGYVPNNYATYCNQMPKAC